MRNIQTKLATDALHFGICQELISCAKFQIACKVGYINSKKVWDTTKFESTGKLISCIFKITNVVFIILFSKYTQSLQKCIQYLCCQVHKLEPFAKVINNFKALTISPKCFFSLDVWQYTGYASALHQLTQKWRLFLRII